MRRRTECARDSPTKARKKNLPLRLESGKSEGHSSSVVHHLSTKVLLRCLPTRTLDVTLASSKVLCMLSSWSVRSLGTANSAHHNQGSSVFIQIVRVCGASDEVGINDLDSSA